MEFPTYISLVKAVRERSHKGLKESKDFVDSYFSRWESEGRAGSTVFDSMPYKELREIVARILVDCVRPDHAPDSPTWFFTNRQDQYVTLRADCECGQAGCEWSIRLELPQQPERTNTLRASLVRWEP